jgi:hypothetical protein
MVPVNTRSYHGRYRLINWIGLWGGEGIRSCKSWASRRVIGKYELAGVRRVRVQTRDVVRLDEGIRTPSKKGGTEVGRNRNVVVGCTVRCPSSTSPTLINSSSASP